MPTGYTRQSVASIVNGNVINASDFNNEFNELIAAFDIVNGHIHDGSTTGGGAPILAINGVSYPGSPSTNTVPVVTSSNTITYEAVPNAALANASLTLGTTNVALGATATTLAGLTLTTASLTAPTITGSGSLTGTISGGTLAGPTINGGPTITGSPSIIGAALTGATTVAALTTSGTLTLGAGVTATGRTITNGTLSGSTLLNCSTGGTLTLGGAVAGASNTISSVTLASGVLSACSTTSTLTLGGGLVATGQTITNGTLSETALNGCSLSGSLTASGQTIIAGTLSGSSLNNCALGAALTITGQSVIGGGTGLLSGCVLASNTVATTQSESDNSTKVATTAFVAGQFTSTASATGLMQAGNGQPFTQWGSATTNGSGVVTITFGTAFSSAVYAIQVTPAGSLTNAAPKVIFYVDTVTTGGFKIHTFDNTNAAVAATVYWSVIGL